MKKSRLVFILLVCVGILFVVSACRTPAGRTTGEVVDDATITTKVKAKIFKDETVSGFAISVETFDGEVTLTGAVDSEKAKTRAEELARSTHGVRKVNNLIKIK
ncbi:MAG TPA: BON domain-containing protein [Desulfobacterales bacterium]|nr:BON domain-containing protein [Desulfobacterales bacterium]